VWCVCVCGVCECVVCVCVVCVHACARVERERESVSVCVRACVCGVSQRTEPTGLKLAGRCAELQDTGCPEGTGAGRFRLRCCCAD